METILIVDDEPGVRLSLAYALRLANFNVEEAKNGKEALNIFAKTRPDLVVLDVKMPGMSGWEVCQAIRNQSKVPIIFLSSKDDEVDQILGLSLGDFNVDYVVKSVTFSPTIFAAKVRAMLNKPGVALLAHQAINVDVDACKTYWEGKEIMLSPVEFHILRTMLKNANKVHSKGSLKQRVCEDATIDSHVRNIRDKFKKINRAVDPIIAVKGYGYRLYSA
jgi:DNA-binding response OmpR family regulator